MKCKSCGRELSDSAKFCNFCGKPLEIDPVQICPKCGMLTEENQCFCAQCGAEITIPNSNIPSESSDSKLEKKKGPKTALLAITALVAVICIAVGIFCITKPTWEKSFLAGMEAWATHDTDKAINCFQKAIELDPMNVTAYQRLSTVYEALGRETDSAEILRQSREVSQLNMVVKNDSRMNDISVEVYDIGGYLVMQFDIDKTTWESETVDDPFISSAEAYTYDFGGRLTNIYSQNCSRDYFYDENGHCISSIWYDEDDNIYAAYDYEIGEDGRRVRETCYDKSRSYETAKYYVTEYQYGDNGLLAQKLTYGYYNETERVLSMREVYEYNEYEDLAKEVRYIEDNAVDRSIIYEYDEYGRLKTETHYDTANMVTEQRNYEYDELGNCISTSISAFGGSEIGTISYSYVYFTDDGNEGIVASIREWIGEELNLELAPDPDLEMWLNEFNSAMESWKQRDFDTAIAGFESVIQLDPGNATAYNRLSDLYLLMGDEQKSVETVSRSMEAIREIECYKNGNWYTSDVYTGGKRTSADCCYWAYRYVYHYDDTENRNLMREIAIDNNTGDFVGENIYTYDDKGNLIEFADHMEGGGKQYTYNEAGQCIRMDYSGYLDDTYIEGGGYYMYEYDTNGNRIKESHTHQYEYEDRVTSEWTSYTYNDRNQIVEENRFDETGLLSQRVYSYDENGNLASDIMYADNRCVYSAEYEYNSYDQKKAEYIKSTGESLTSRKTYMYDEYGNLILEKEYDGSGDLVSVKCFSYYIKGHLASTSEFLSNGYLEDRYSYDYSYWSAYR